MRFDVFTHAEMAQRLRIIAANPTYHRDVDNRAALQEAATRLDLLADIEARNEGRML